MSELRASDADREAVITALRRHHADGRITSEELEERIGAVWATKLVSGLAAITADLPDLDRAPAPAPPAHGRLPWTPGRESFSAHWPTAASPAEAMLALLQEVAPRLNAAGYALVERTGDRLVFVRSRIPGWAWPVAVLTFPFGLLALLARTEDQVRIDVVAQPGGPTMLYAGGVAPLSVRRAIALFER